MSIHLTRTWIAVCLALLFAILTFHVALPVMAEQTGVQDPHPPVSAWGSCWVVVRPGDNLFRIAVRYGVSFRYLALINGLYNPNYIYAGMTLTVPCDNYPPPRPPRPPKPCAPAQTYLVKPHDNLFRIALNYGTTIIALRDANHLWGRVLRPNTRLIIPCPGSVQYPNQTPLPPTLGETPLPPPPTQEPPPPTEIPEATTSPLPDNNTEPTVHLQNTQINPTQLDIHLGQSVTWTNDDQVTYTLLSGIPGQPNGVFKSDPIPPGGTFNFKFEAGGSYTYYVDQYPTMVGQINVSP